jgi:hypothetical protein
MAADQDAIFVEICKRHKTPVKPKNLILGGHTVFSADLSLALRINVLIITILSKR